MTVIDFHSVLVFSVVIHVLSVRVGTELQKDLFDFAIGV